MPLKILIITKSLLNMLIFIIIMVTIIIIMNNPKQNAIRLCAGSAK